MPTSPIRRILTQITYLKTSRKSAMGKAVFHSSLRTTAAHKRLRSRGHPAGSKNKFKVPADVAPSFKSHVVQIGKGSDIVQGLATFAANNLDEKADDPEPKA